MKVQTKIVYRFQGEKEEKHINDVALALSDLLVFNNRVIAVQESGYNSSTVIYFTPEYSF
jgi:hypothetical protein